MTQICRYRAVWGYRSRLILELPNHLSNLAEIWNSGHFWGEDLTFGQKLRYEYDLRRKRAIRKDGSVLIFFFQICFLHRLSLFTCIRQLFYMQMRLALENHMKMYLLAPSQSPVFGNL